MRDDLCREAGHQWVCHFDHNRCMACGTVQGIEATAADKPTVSDEAVEAAVTAYFGKHDGDYISDGQRHLMRAALAAAQPLMVADAVAGERLRIAAAIEAQILNGRATAKWDEATKNAARIDRSGADT